MQSNVKSQFAEMAKLFPDLARAMVASANQGYEKEVTAKINNLYQIAKRDHDNAEYRRVVMVNGLADQIVPFDLDRETLREKAETIVKGKGIIPLELE